MTRADDIAVGEDTDFVEDHAADHGREGRLGETLQECWQFHSFSSSCPNGEQYTRPRETRQANDPSGTAHLMPFVERILILIGLLIVIGNAKCPRGVPTRHLLPQEKDHRSFCPK